MSRALLAMFLHQSFYYDAGLQYRHGYRRRRLAEPGR